MGNSERTHDRYISFSSETRFLLSFLVFPPQPSHAQTTERRDSSRTCDTALLMAFGKSTGLKVNAPKASATAPVAGGGFGGFSSAQPGQGTSPFRVTVRACLLHTCTISLQCIRVLCRSIYSVFCIASPARRSSVWPSESAAASCARSTVCTGI